MKLKEAIAQGTGLKKWPLPGVPTLDSTWARLPALLAALDLPPLAMEKQQVASQARHPQRSSNFNTYTHTQIHKSMSARPGDGGQGHHRL